MLKFIKKIWNRIKKYFPKREFQFEPFIQNELEAIVELRQHNCNAKCSMFIDFLQRHGYNAMIVVIQLPDVPDEAHAIVLFNGWFVDCTTGAIVKDASQWGRPMPGYSKYFQ
jgi:Cdc6-like AAA superfamily ATPase